MNEIVYIDVLICLNLFVNYFLLIATAKFLNLHTKRIRLILASFLGSIYSLVILIPNFSVILSILLMISMVTLIIFISFGFKHIKSFLCTVACFFSMNFAFAGVMFFLWKLFSPKGLMINNGIVYFNLSPIILVSGTVMAYIVIRLINRMAGRGRATETYYKAQINLDNNHLDILTKIDTCNNLVEPFSNLPVIVAKEESIIKILPNINEAMVENNIKMRSRVIPYKTIENKGTLMAFKPDSITVYKGDKEYKKDAYVAVCKTDTLGEEYDALINPLLID